MIDVNEKGGGGDWMSTELSDIKDKIVKTIDYSVNLMSALKY